MTLDPGNIIAWLIVGLIAGFLASLVVRGGGMGILGDIIVGIVGAFVGGFVANLLGFSGSQGFIGSIVVAFIGAVILLLILRALTGARSTV
ncbi:MAG TPA: GlsB/YeaQ/YmgE family stress response membrane protein [Chloroflexia bacterium]|nr:GlsB/YeaQ/YmgE family stress response membrane protein [Chloroflexia bacterium]